MGLALAVAAVVQTELVITILTLTTVSAIRIVVRLRMIIVPSVTVINSIGGSYIASNGSRR
jgi:hypothetical protein